ncbi:acyltransferase family protein [Nibribacter ruber]|uniref:Acyltransferase family protein n=1 Tax=Nibribacter ruber TaxID=2698458 RepID=A0A6P1NWZ0_9BACT|nr:acyltransferase [Nibribacter ruber]QHL86438.1 acyltransferase family protein [Nibribacter ruber]
MGKLPESLWLYSHGLESVFRSGLALFLLLSGALLIPRVENPFAFLKKRVLRIFPAFIIWSLLYAYLNQRLFNVSVLELAVNIWQGMEMHLWFVKVILVLYVVLAFTGKAITKSTYQNVLFCWLTGQTLLMVSLIDQETVWIIEARNYLAGFLLMLLGFMLTRTYLPAKKCKNLGMALTAAGITATFAFGYSHSNHTGQLQDFYYSIVSPTIQVKSVGIFLLFSTLQVKKERSRRLLKDLSYSTFGIYLSHLIFRDSVLHQVGITYTFINPYLGIVVTALSCFLLSGVFIYLLSKFKFGKLFT